MRNLVTGVAFSVLFTVNAAAVTPSMLTFVQLVDFCTSKTLAEAEAKGDQLGWRRLTPAELENWRTSYIASTGNTVEGTGWRRGDKDGGDSLSFWVARGPSQHRACAYPIPQACWTTCQNASARQAISKSTTSEPRLLGNLA
jgi:hypothetical protein